MRLTHQSRRSVRLMLLSAVAPVAPRSAILGVTMAHGSGWERGSLMSAGLLRSGPSRMQSRSADGPRVSRRNNRTRCGALEDYERAPDQRSGAHLRQAPADRDVRQTAQRGRGHPAKLPAQPGDQRGTTGPAHRPRRRAGNPRAPVCALVTGPHAAACAPATERELRWRPHHGDRRSACLMLSGIQGAAHAVTVNLPRRRARARDPVPGAAGSAQAIRSLRTALLPVPVRVWSLMA